MPIIGREALVFPVNPTPKAIVVSWDSVTPRDPQTSADLSFLSITLARQWSQEIHDTHIYQSLFQSTHRPQIDQAASECQVDRLEATLYGDRRKALELQLMD